MKINKQFIAAQGAKALPSKPGGCCGTAASKQFVFPTDQPEPCCAEIPCSSFFSQTTNSGSPQISDLYTFSGLTCPVDICFQAITQEPGRDFLYLISSIGGIALSELIPTDGQFVCKSFNNGDQFYFNADSDKCNQFFIYIINQTCNVDCGNQIIIQVNTDLC